MKKTNKKPKSKLDSKYAGNGLAIIADIAYKVSLVALVFLAIIVMIDMKVEKILNSHEFDLPKIEITLEDVEERISKKFEEYKLENEANFPVWNNKIEMELPDPTVADGSFKTYLPYPEISKRTSKQYYFQQLCWTDVAGFRRFNNDYVIALGSFYFNHIGERFEIHLSSGKVFTASVGDIKWDTDTDPSNRFIQQNGNIVEFIVDVTVLPDLIITDGTISPLGFEGSVTKIIKLNN